jgi:hypothetical protein
MKQARERWDGIPASMCEQPRAGSRAFYSNNFGIHFEKRGDIENSLQKADWQVLKIANGIAKRLS